MAGAELLARVRRGAGLSQDELARRAGTSRTAVSAYEHGRKSPALDTVDRLVSAAGYELDARPRVEFVRVPGARGRDVFVPTALPRLPVEQALATVELPLTLNWSQPGRSFGSLTGVIGRGSMSWCCARAHRLTSSVTSTAYCWWTCGTSWCFPRAVRAAWSPLIAQIIGDVGCVWRRVVTDEPGGRFTAFQLEVACCSSASRRARAFCWLGEGHCWRKD